MSLIKVYTTPFFKVGVWKIEEEEEELRSSIDLSSYEEQKLHQINVPSLRKAFLACRRILQKHLNIPESIDYDSKGKPFMKGGMHISMSHNPNHAAVIISPQFPVGIDIESFRPQVVRIKNKFCSDQELKWMQIDDEIKHLTMVWNAKETMLKIAGDKSLTFKTQLLLKPFPCANFARSKGCIYLQNKPHSSCQLFWQVEKDYSLCFGHLV